MGPFMELCSRKRKCYPVRILILILVLTSAYLLNMVGSSDRIERVTMTSSAETNSTASMSTHRLVTATHRLVTATHRLVTATHLSVTETHRLVEVTHPPTTKSIAPKLLATFAPRNGRSRLSGRMPIAGRLGNDMFVYASIFCQGRLSNRSSLQRPSRLKAIFPNLTLEYVPPKMGPIQSLQERWPGTYDDKLIANLNKFSEKNVDIVGYFQSWRYFNQCRSSIKEEFKFDKEINQLVQNFLRQSSRNILNANGSDAERVIFVGVHIRRGDMLVGYNINRGYTTAPKTYLDKAIAFYEKEFEASQRSILFVVTTDSLEWAIENFKPTQTKFVVSKGDIRAAGAKGDLALMAACNHSIITVGSYGWWGAYLAGGKTVYYKKFTKPGSALAGMYKDEDYFLPSWIGYS